MEAKAVAAPIQRFDDSRLLGAVLTVPFKNTCYYIRTVSNPLPPASSVIACVVECARRAFTFLVRLILFIPTLSVFLIGRVLQVLHYYVKGETERENPQVVKTQGFEFPELEASNKTPDLRMFWEPSKRVERVEEVSKELSYFELDLKQAHAVLAGALDPKTPIHLPGEKNRVFSEQRSGELIASKYRVECTVDVKSKELAIVRESDVMSAGIGSRSGNRLPTDEMLDNLILVLRQNGYRVLRFIKEDSTKTHYIIEPYAIDIKSIQSIASESISV
jgi:hypothetical protein